MSIANREKSQMQPVVQKENTSPTESYLAKIAEDLNIIRSHQGSLLEAFIRMKDEVSATVTKMQTENKVSAAEREKFNTKTAEILTGLQTVIKELNNQVKGYTGKHEQTLAQASVEVKSLKGELTTGLMALAHRMVPIKQRLGTVAIIAGSSVIGAVILFLIAELFLEKK